MSQKINDSDAHDSRQMELDFDIHKFVEFSKLSSLSSLYSYDYSETEKRLIVSVSFTSPLFWFYVDNDIQQ